MNILEVVINKLPSLHKHHKTDSSPYKLLNELTTSLIKESFHSAQPTPQPFGPFGHLLFPYFEMGKINSTHLFGLDELILFSFYWVNRNKYSKVLDIGANIGLHSIVLARCGFEVEAYEPDDLHFSMLQKNLALNNCMNVHTHKAAVSTKSGRTTFVKVLGNTTSSHILGSKTPYGETESYEVDVLSFEECAKDADLVKMDVEGHEATILCSLSKACFDTTDMLVEVGSRENAEQIFSHLQAIGVSAFSQKRNWSKVKKCTDMPFSYRDGTLFISAKEAMPWAE